MTGLLTKNSNAIVTFLLMTFCLLLYYNEKQKISLGYSMPGVQYLSQCQCYRYHGQDTISHSANISLANTTCSEDAYYKGSHQKVISFTYFEPSESEEESVPNNKTNRDYFLGIRENLSLVKKFYPGYNMRLYYQVFSDISRAELCHLGNYFKFNFPPVIPPNYFVIAVCSTSHSGALRHLIWTLSDRKEEKMTIIAKIVKYKGIFFLVYGHYCI